MKERLLISACLLGMPTRYDGEIKVYPQVDALREKYELVPVCPEVMGGLSVPRAPSERVGERVMSKNGTDVSDAYERGAMLTLSVAAARGCRKALLKERSPACGKGMIYDGSFTSTLTEGNGVAAELLLSEGIEVYGESEISKLL